MDEKYLFGLLGIVLGSFLSATFAIVKELYAESRAKKKEAEYLAIRLVCIFESFMEGCASVVGDDGTYLGQPDADGYCKVQVQEPTLDVQLDDVNWKSLPPALMYEILYFPNIVADAEAFINSTFEYSSSPPDYSEGFEERQYQYSQLGLEAFEVASKLREKYKIPKNHASSWDIIEYMNTQKTKIQELRKRRESEHKKLFAASNA